MLLLHGWTSWNSSASIIAASQSGKTLWGPVLEALDDSGQWRLATGDMGVPAGLPRTILIDLRGLLREGERVVRIRTNRTVHFDQALAADVVEAIEPSAAGRGPIRVTPIPLLRADLRRLGYPRRMLPGGKPPETSDYQQIHAGADWADHEGFFTRFGDVVPLLAARDDRFAVMAHGGEVALSFDAGSLPALASGSRRSYFLYSDGYEKGMDPHGAHPFTVEPMPFHAMEAYPYPPDSYPLDRAHLEYLLEWNTRPGGAGGSR